MEKNVKQSERGENTMADLLATFALLTFAGVAGLVMMVIALYVASAALDATKKRKEDKE